MQANPFASRASRRAFSALILIVLLVALWQIRSILLLLLTSVIIVVFLTTPLRFLIRRGMRRGPALLVSTLIIPLFFFILALTVLPLLGSQFATLSQRVTEGQQLLLDIWENLDAPPPPLFLGWSYPVTGLDLPRDPLASLLATVALLVEDFQVDTQVVTQVANQLASALGQFSVSVIPVVGGVASFFLNTLIIIFMSLYLLADPAGHENGLIRLLPVDYRARGREIIARMDQSLRGWLESTLLAMVFVAALTWLGLTSLGLAEALALGVIAGLLAFVPTFGTLIAALLAVVVGILEQPQNVVWIVLVTYGISLVQSQVISPLLVADRLRIPPIVVLLSQIIAAVFFGFMGILLAVPLAAILLVLVEEVYVKDILGDRAGNAELESGVAGKIEKKRGLTGG